MLTFQWMSFIILLYCYIGKCKSDTYILYDTKAATSDLQWTLQPAYNGWEELSNLDLDGNTIRAYQVCNYNKSGQDNWARSPYIDAKASKRVYIDIEFAVMECDDCRETFTLYYYPSSTNVASTTFPPWRENPYIKLDTIAASERFDSDTVGPYGINKKTLVISQLQRRGFYIAVQDQGACMALMSVKLYFNYCPEVTQNLAFFPMTASGGKAASLVSVNGKCVENAIYANNEIPKYRCNSNGKWTVPTGFCHCKAGFSQSSINTTCEACSAGYYKARAGNNACRKCPFHSRASTQGSFNCKCDPGYFRATFESEDYGCTRPPSPPYNLTYSVNGTMVDLGWLPPISTGNRSDIYFSITCKECDKEFKRCSFCPHDVNYHPLHHHRITETSVVVTDLKRHSSYIFKVTSHNGVSLVSRQAAAFAEIRIKMTEDFPPKMVNVTLIEKDHQSVTLRWDPARIESGNPVIYGVIIDAINLKNAIDFPTGAPRYFQVSDCNITISDLFPNTEYRVQVRALAPNGRGQFCKPLLFQTQPKLTPKTKILAGVSTNVAMIAGAVAGSLILVILLVSVMLVKRRRRLNQEKRVRMKLSDDSHHLLKKNYGFSNGISRSSERKTYVDYRDPHQGVKEVAFEIDQSQITIKRVIGQGEFGEVCFGKLREGKKNFPVAVKRLRHEASLMDQTNFLREACNMAQFCHPNVVQFKGVVTKSIPAMIITEYMENGSLDQFLQEKQGDLSLLQMLKMLQGIASGMNYLSQMSFIHRDLAARNILVDSELVCKVSDFGLSRTLENNPHATYTTQGGKIALRWTAPECIRFHRFTSSSDVWSYGIVMWEVMSYGEKPYWDMTNEDVSQVIEDGYRLPAPANCPQALHNLMLLCWIYEEKRRPKFQKILHKINQFLLLPKTLTEKVEMIDISGSLLQPNASSNLEDQSSADGCLNMVKLTKYGRSFPISDVNNDDHPNNITASDLERLGVVSPDHLRFQNGFDSLRQSTSTDHPVSITPNGSRTVFPSDLSTISSSSGPQSSKQPYFAEPALV